jgi:hypothetical protein
VIPDVSKEYVSIIFKDRVEHKGLDKNSTFIRNVGMTYQITQPYISGERNPANIINEIYNQSGWAG